MVPETIAEMSKDNMSREGDTEWSAEAFKHLKSPVTEG